MESLKWIGSVLLSILGLCILLGMSAMALFAGAMAGGVLLVAGVVGFVAFCIKDYFEDRARCKAHRAK